MYFGYTRPIAAALGVLWPGSACQLGWASMAIHANRVMWEFWQRHPTP